MIICCEGRKWRQMDKTETKAAAHSFDHPASRIEADQELLADRGELASALVTNEKCPAWLLLKVAIRALAVV